jgi:hypothetical protein
MIIVRNTFQLKFGKAKEAKDLIAENQKLVKKYNIPPSRYLTDLTGPFYILEMEVTAKDLSDYEKQSSEMMKAPEFGEWYKKFIPLIESGSRTIYNVLDV